MLGNISCYAQSAALWKLSIAELFLVPYGKQIQFSIILRCLQVPLLCDYNSNSSWYLNLGNLWCTSGSR